jgi:uncharacterized protein YndB with AHSA1/START domain
VTQLKGSKVAIIGPEVGGGRVVREVVLPAPPTAVWEWLTQPEQLSAWLASRVELDLRPGGTLRLESRDGARFGVVEAVTPFEYLAFRWRQVIPGRDGPLLGPGTRVEFVLQPEGTSTRLRVEEAALRSWAASPRGVVGAQAGSQTRLVATAASAGSLR